MKKLKKIEISIFFLKKKTILHSTSKQTTPIKNIIQYLYVTTWLIGAPRKTSRRVGSSSCAHIRLGVHERRAVDVIRRTTLHNVNVRLGCGVCAGLFVRGGAQEVDGARRWRREAIDDCWRLLTAGRYGTRRWRGTWCRRRFARYVLEQWAHPVDLLFYRVAAQRQRAVAAHHLERFWRGFRFAAAFGDATDAAALLVVVEKLIWHRFNHRATMIEQNGAVVRVLSRRHWVLFRYCPHNHICRVCCKVSFCKKNSSKQNFVKVQKDFQMKKTRIVYFSSK